MNSQNAIRKKKKHRSVLNLETKLGLIEKYESGKKTAALKKEFGMPESTIRTIIRHREKYKSLGKTVAGTIKLVRSRDDILVAMEKELVLWISYQDDTNLITSQIQTKAKEIFEKLKPNWPDNKLETFVASRGWFEKFKVRSGLWQTYVPVKTDVIDENDTESTAILHNIIENGIPSDKCETDLQDEVNLQEGIAINYGNILHDFVTDGDYTPNQVFNLGETNLFWKRMPNNTTIDDDEKSKPGFKPGKDCLTLLLGGNVAGDFKIKPLLIYHSENPRALKGFLKSKLPVVWRSNKKAKLNQTIFYDWFCQTFMPSVRNYLRDNQLNEKALLILDNATYYPSNLEDLCDGIVKVVVLPSITTNQSYLIYQDVITTFKAIYHNLVFQQCYEKLLGQDKPTILDIWRNYNIRNGIDNINTAWNQVYSFSINVTWQNVWPDWSNYFEYPTRETLDEIEMKIIEIGKQLGFEHLTIDDIKELIQSHNKDDKRDIVKIEDDCVPDDECEEAEVKTLTTLDLRKLFNHWESMKTILQENDPNMERSLSIIRGIENEILCYRDLLNAKQKLTNQNKLKKKFHIKKEK